MLSQLLKVASLALLALTIFCCSDDNELKEKGNDQEYVLTDSVANAYILNDIASPLTWANIKMSTLESGDYEIRLGANANAYQAYIKLSGKHDGKIIDLTQDDTSTGTKFKIEFEYIMEKQFSLVGDDPFRTSKVSSGTVYVKALNLEKRIFEVTLNVTLPNGYTYRIDYKGTLSKL
jgi:hypothetical protein